MLIYNSVVTVREGLEWAALISQVAVAGTAIFALRQIQVLRQDLRLRMERAAKEKAVEFASRYLGEYVRLNKAWFDERKGVGKLFEGPYHVDFDLSRIPKDKQADYLKREPGAELPALNELDAIAAAFVTGVADEATGFEIIGRTFVRSVESHYFYLCVVNSNASPYFTSVRILYRVWSQRLTKRELLEHQASLDASLAALTDSSIDSIGSKVG